jgi:hypothetical protein
MSVGQAMDNFLKNIDKNWIQPELERRRASASLPDGFVIYQALIRLPRGRDPIVEFNQEIGWSAKMQIAPDAKLDKGDLVYMHHVQKVETVDPPKVDGDRVAFIYLWHRGGGNYRILFDFSPNSPDYQSPTHDWPHGQLVAESIQEMFEEHVIKMYEPREKDLVKLGLWAARRIVPYPLSEIVRRVGQGDETGALAYLNDYFTVERLEEVFQSWRANPVFDASWLPFESALNSIRQNNTIAAIYTLVPQIEGIISAWLYSVLPHDQVPFRPESKAKKFVDTLRASGPRMYVTERLIDALAAFLIEGPVQSVFKSWLGTLDPSFPNRHVVAHGRFEEQLFDRANLLKLVLLLDSISDVTKPPGPDIIGA